MTVSPNDLHRSIEAAKALRAQIAELVGDERAVQDTFDGETTLDVELRNALLAEDEDRILIDGIKKREEDLSERRRRAERRMEARRGLIEQAMAIAGWTKHQTDIGTISLGKAQARLEIDDEAEIPSQFWKVPEPPEPVVDKQSIKPVLVERQKAIEAAMKIEDKAARAARLRLIDAEHPPIPGCHLETGGHVLSIRRK